jgi:outer membrane autotransporter protein
MTLTGKLLIAAAAMAAFSGSAMAADLYVPPAAAPAAAPATTNWDGAYIGASLGYAWGTATSTAPVGTASPGGWLVGVDAGYNFHVSDNIVLGIEGNLDWLNETVTTTVAPAGTFTANWDGSLRARLGVDVDNILPYIEAGVAFANATASVPGTSFSNTQTGWTVGAGVEAMLADQLSANLEVRYNNYGSATYGGAPIAFTDTQLRVGLNYHFQ